MSLGNPGPWRLYFDVRCVLFNLRFDGVVLNDSPVSRNAIVNGSNACAFGLQVSAEGRDDVDASLGFWQGSGGPTARPGEVPAPSAAVKARIPSANFERARALNAVDSIYKAIGLGLRIATDYILNN